MSEIKQFKTETKRLLNLMINSIYTNKEIFLRELIANASDAIDKYHYLSLTDEKLEKRNDYKIELSIDVENRTITISDNGIGMTKDELIDHLGTIAKSGSKEFQEKFNHDNVSPEDEREIIGQFGVGFYSSYLVADLVEVNTLSPYSDTSYRFTSDGIEEYSLENSNKTEVGTTITLHLRENTEDINYDEYLDQFTIKSLVKKYSDFIRYPIMMECTTSMPKLDEDGNETDEYVDTITTETLNSMIPVWKKNKSDVTKEEINEFYKNKFYDFQDPLDYYQYSVEGNITYTALLFIPKKAPYDLYSNKYEKGLQLYTKGVFIMDKCAELLPDYLRFIKGIVDSSDLSLNISREMLQHDRQLTKIASNLEKKVVKHLSELQNDEPEIYKEFFEALGINIKFGIYNSYGEKNDLLKGLLMYKSLHNDSLISLDDYVREMKEGQKYIYYASCESKEDLLSMPQMDALKKKNFDVLILTDEVDEFVLQVLKNHNDIEFKSVNQGELDLLNDEEKENIKKLSEEKQSLLEKIKSSLNGKVKDVVISTRLTDSPVCLVSGDGISFEMERVINDLPNGSNLKAERILELNPEHPIFKVLESIQDDNEKLSDYALVLLNQALLLEGFKVENPNEFIAKMCNIMIEANNINK
ncbi:MAG: molecular chaperone HtpG [Bacilli bacterium]|nr:molecular chaperone HtpG [Bacilli bacterium]